MVRLSLIVLGLLAAVWCFSGTTDGVKIKKTWRGTLLICARGQMIKVEKCYKIRSSCPRVSYSRGSVKCFSLRWARIIKRCTRKRVCGILRRISKGPYACKYRCVRARYVRRCHGSRRWRRCHLYKRMCRTRWGRRRCGLYRRVCNWKKSRCRWIPRCHRTRRRRFHCHGKA